MTTNKLTDRKLNKRTNKQENTQTNKRQNKTHTVNEQAPTQIDKPTHTHTLAHTALFKYVQNTEGYEPLRGASGHKGTSTRKHIPAGGGYY